MTQSGGKSSGLPLSEMGPVLLVFAELLKNVPVGQQIVGHVDGKRLGVRLRIVEGHFPIQVSEVAAAEALGDAQRFAMQVARSIENRFIIEAGGLHHEDV